MPPADAELDRVARLLLASRRVVILTGAGVSAESGLATFRDPEEGLWAEYDPMDLATIGAFERDPELVTRWYHWRFTKARDVQPNPGHHALADLESWLIERHGPEAFTLITQNIDGLHQRAGSERVVELHGSIHRWRCTETGAQQALTELSFDRFPIPSPHGGLMRPCVVWFGEALPDEALAISGAALDQCDVFLSIGTSATVQPAASFIEIASERGATTVEINRDPTPISGFVEIALQGASGEVLPRLMDRIRELANASGSDDT